MEQHRPTPRKDTVAKPETPARKGSEHPFAFQAKRTQSQGTIAPIKAVNYDILKPSDEVLLKSAGLPLNDEGNGSRLAMTAGHKLMYLARLGWFVWNGNVWNADEDGLKTRSYAHQIGNLMEREARLLQLGPDERDIIEQARSLRPRLDQLINMRTRSHADEREYVELDRIDSKARQLQQK